MTGHHGLTGLAVTVTSQLTEARATLECELLNLAGMPPGSPYQVMMWEGLDAIAEGVLVLEIAGAGFDTTPFTNLDTAMERAIARNTPADPAVMLLGLVTLPEAAPPPPPRSVTSQIISCPDCRQVLLIISDPYDPGLPAEMAVKVDGHVCPAPTVT